MSQVMDSLRAIRDLLQTSVMFIHHSAKAGAETNGRRGGQRMRGSSAIHGSLDGGLYLSDLKGDLQTEWTNRVEVEVKGARGAGAGFLRLSVDDDELTKTASRAEWTFSREPFAVSKKDEQRERERMDRVLAVLRGAQAEGGRPLSMTKIADRAGIRKGDAPGLLAQLRIEGRVVQEGRGGWRISPPVPAVPSQTGTTSPERFRGFPPLRGEPGPLAVPENRTGEVES